MVDLVADRNRIHENRLEENKVEETRARERSPASPPVDSSQQASDSTEAQTKPAESTQSQPPQLNNDIAETLVRHFKLLADETRLRILFYLMQRKELNVRSLCDLLDQSQPAVSHHLALLRNAELIDSRRDGKHNFYHLMPSKFQQLIDTLAVASPGVPRSVQFNDYVNIPSE